MSLIVSAAVAAMVLTAAPAAAESVCPQIERREVARYDAFPERLRMFAGDMAERGGAWNSTDVMHRNNERLPTRRYIAGGDMGEGRWLIVYEWGGIVVRRHVDVWRVAADGRIARELAVTEGNVEAACAAAAEKLGR